MVQSSAEWSHSSFAAACGRVQLLGRERIEIEPIISGGLYKIRLHGLPVSEAAHGRESFVGFSLGIVCTERPSEGIEPIMGHCEEPHRCLPPRFISLLCVPMHEPLGGCSWLVAPGLCCACKRVRSINDHDARGKGDWLKRTLVCELQRVWVCREVNRQQLVEMQCIKVYLLSPLRS